MNTLKRVEYVRCSMFATSQELRATEQKKARLENAGYTLVHSGPSMLTYALRAKVSA